MNRKDIEKEFNVVNGHIETLGKFEGEPVYAPYYYDLIMNGSSDYTDYGPDEFSTVVDYFEVTEDDLSEFPELEGVQTVMAYETDQGFFICRPYS